MQGQACLILHFICAQPAGKTSEMLDMNVRYVFLQYFEIVNDA